MKVIIIGSGIAGLNAGYFLSQQNNIEVTILEKESYTGGLAGSFPIDGKNFIERYYHFICIPDTDYLNLINELDLNDYLHWTPTTMGLFYNGNLYPFGKIMNLFGFPYFTLSEKFQFGWGAFKSKRCGKNDWKDLENITAEKWLSKEFSPKAYEILYKPLLKQKFFADADKISAAWMWARINRLGNSRTKIMQREKLGFLEGGTQRLIDKLSQCILQNKGQIINNAAVTQIAVEQNKIKGVYVADTFYPADVIISTVAIPSFLKLANNQNGEYFINLKQIKYIGVICALMRLKKPLTNNFWVNINDPRIPLAGIIEYTNLNRCEYLDGDSIIYIPQYLPSSEPKFSASNDTIINEYIKYLKIINAKFNNDWIKASFVFRNEYAQPICEVGFTRKIPSMKTSVAGLYTTDSFQLHPDDRAVSHSIRLAKQVTALVKSDYKL